MIYFTHLSKFKNIEHGLTEKGDTLPENIVFGEQIHKEKLAWVEDSSRLSIPKVDALATRKTDVMLGVKAADCVPLLFADAGAGIVGTIHAGWRGTALEVSRKSIEALRVRPFKLFVGLGPAICPDCFLVGKEVANQFDKSVVTESETEEGKFHVDLWQANVLQLIDAGVPERNIEVIRRCTFEDEKLYSFRAGDRDVRILGFIQRTA